MFDPVGERERELDNRVNIVIMSLAVFCIFFGCLRPRRQDTRFFVCQLDELKSEFPPREWVSAVYVCGMQGSKAVVTAAASRYSHRAPPA
eukprot:5774578-Pyramimonas_sp.AAC.1